MSRPAEPWKRQAKGDRLERRAEIPGDVRELRVLAPFEGARGRLPSPRAQACVVAEQVAHWPQTHSHQWCGDGAVAASPAPGATCANCFYWRQPGGGLNPVDRGDMPMAWWAHAGYCARHAPRPVSEPGARAFWRATHAADACAEGQPGERDNPAV